MVMDKASQLDGSELTLLKAGAVENDRCTSLQQDKWRNFPFLQDMKPTDCFFADEAEGDLVAVFDLNHKLNWLWYMQYNIVRRLWMLNAFSNIVCYPLVMAADTVVSGAGFDWHEYARSVLLVILSIAAGYLVSIAAGYLVIFILCLIVPSYRKSAPLSIHLMNGLIIGWLPCYQPHRPIFWDLRSVHVAVARDGIKFAKERRSSICCWPFTRNSSSMDPRIITVPFHDIADCELVTASANLEPHSEVRLIARLRTDIEEDVDNNDAFVWCQIAIPYLKHGEEFQQLVREIIKQQKKIDEEMLDKDHEKKATSVLNFTELFDNQMQKKIRNEGTITIISWASWASVPSSLPPC